MKTKLDKNAQASHTALNFYENYIELRGRTPTLKRSNRYRHMSEQYLDTNMFQMKSKSIICV